MSITNLGSQSTRFEYKTQATGAEFSKFLRGVVKPGIYSGGAVTATTPGVGSELVLAAFNAIFNCDSDKIAHTTTAATITATMPTGKNVWYMTYAYLPVVENWIDFGYRVDTDPAVANEIIICKCTWSGALYTGNVTAIDYTYRTFGLYDSTYNARFDKNVAVDGVVTIANVTDSSTKDTGCLIVEGGIGVEKTLTTGGKVLVKDTTSSTTKDTGCLIVEGGIGVEENLVTGGKVLIKDVTDSSTKDTGCLIVEGGIGVEKTLTTGGKVLVKDTTSSTTKDTGCVIVEGGIGVEENLVTGGKVLVKDTTTSTTKDTGCLIVEGGVGIEENLNMGGILKITGAAHVTGILYAPLVSTATKTADYVITDTDELNTIFVDPSARACTITLPTLAANLNRVIDIKNIATGGWVNVAGEGAETIDGLAGFIMYTAGDHISVVGETGGWRILSKNRKYSTGWVSAGSDWHIRHMGTITVTTKTGNANLYTVGELITEETSGNTWRIDSITAGDPGALVVRAISGTGFFTLNRKIPGTTSGAPTANIQVGATTTGQDCNVIHNFLRSPNDGILKTQFYVSIDQADANSWEFGMGVVDSDGGTGYGLCIREGTTSGFKIQTPSYGAGWISNDDGTWTALAAQNYYYKVTVTE